VSEYMAHPDDPPELLHECPACHAPVGAWCGGFGDVHEERTELAKKDHASKRTAS